MGRKIPAKKHKGVKDPLKQQAERMKRLQGKINAPPKDPDDQPIPKTLERLFAFQKKDTIVTKITNTHQAKPNKTKRAAGGAERSGVGGMRRLPGESGRSFAGRINSAVRALHGGLDASDYPDDAEADDRRSELLDARREKRERKKERRGADKPEKLSRSQKEAQKKRERLRLQEEEGRELAGVERVAWGDVAHAPPKLGLPGRAQASGRPGQRTLLLHSLLGGSGGAEGAGAAVDRPEQARLLAVEAYRRLKRARALAKASDPKNKRSRNRLC